MDEKGAAVRALVAVHLALMLLPAVAGVLDVVLGSTLVAPGLDRGQDATQMLDSNLRFYAGMWLGALVYLLWALRDLAARSRHVEAFWGLVFLGGIARVVGFVHLGPPPALFIAFAVIELVLPPVMVVWIRRSAVGGAAALAYAARGATGT